MRNKLRLRRYPFACKIIALHFRPLPFLLFICLSTRVSLTAQTIVTFEGFNETTPKWFDQRVVNAKKGKKEIIEMPLVVRSRGWSCDCPLYYMGDSPLSSTGFWISPVIPQTGKFPQSDSLGHVLWVKGFFTGRTTKESYGDPMDSIIYICPVFKIKTWKEETSHD